MCVQHRAANPFQTLRDRVETSSAQLQEKKLNGWSMEGGRLSLVYIHGTLLSLKIFFVVWGRRVEFARVYCFIYVFT